LNPAGEHKVERFGWSFAPGDKVMQIENDYDEVYNGDVGYVTGVEPDGGELTAIFDGRLVTYGFGELDTLVPAHAATIHKSQGSEYLAVVIPVVTQQYPMLQRSLLYRGITRRALSAYVTFIIGGDGTARLDRELHAAMSLPQKGGRKIVAHPVLDGLHHIYGLAE
jgi:ATP-dependent RecD-like DNA helicase SH3 domain/UvrD-like helicase C-terminal domain